MNPRARQAKAPARSAPRYVAPPLPIARVSQRFKTGARGGRRSSTEGSTASREGSGRTAERFCAGRRPRKRPEASRGGARRSAPRPASCRADASSCRDLRPPHAPPGPPAFCFLFLGHWGPRGEAPRFRGSETPNGDWGRVRQHSSPACAIKALCLSVALHGWEPEGGSPPSAIVS